MSELKINFDNASDGSHYNAFLKAHEAPTAPDNLGAYGNALGSLPAGSADGFQPGDGETSYPAE